MSNKSWPGLSVGLVDGRAVSGAAGADASTEASAGPSTVSSLTSMTNTSVLDLARRGSYGPSQTSRGHR